jgi:hypothetical protein
MTEDPDCARKRKPPTELKVSEESIAALRARLNSAEGPRCLAESAKLRAERAAKMMPIEILQAVETEEGDKVVDEVWPDVANAYFKPAPTAPIANSPH